MSSRVLKFEADDLSAEDIVVTGELRDSNSLIGDPARLKAHYEEQGYLLLRNVLNLETVAAARSKVMAVLQSRGMVAPGAQQAIWTGAGWGDLHEDSPEFSGIGQALVEDPAVTDFFKRILGEPFMLLPIIQYRFYPPTYSLGIPHQDGFYTQVQGFSGAWIPLVDIDAEMGGLGLAVGVSRRGFLHNLDKPPPSPIPKAAIPAGAWCRADFHPGDVLMIHPCTPHCALPNKSNRLRLSLDVRLVPNSSAKNVFSGTVIAVDSRSLTLRNKSGATLKLDVDDDTYIRCTPSSLRVPLAELTSAATPGLQIMALHDDGHATMLRRTSE